ncbi:ASTRA complex subunit [Curvularia kusanoi]|uniref:ASTRA-associated protein 1 n=1 Tax=Curvularia kusanoi TaxID=90978 RepID=A0A9P4TGL6_CURKU|nr:ASTRA complex subunit [Curvularia kusanoi]
MAAERQSSTLPPAQPSYILRGHTAQIHSVQFARENTRLITGDADGWVIFWKLETKRALAVWKAHDGAILGTAEWARDKVITHGRDNNLRIWQIRSEDESTLSPNLPSEGFPGDRSMPWLLHTLPVNTLNFCAFSMCYAHAKGQTSGNEGSDAAPEADSNKTASILVAVPARDDKMAEVYQFPEERLRYVVPRAQSKDTGMVMAIKLVHAPTTQQTLVITGYEGGLTAVHLLPKDDSSAIGVAQLLYLSQPHTQPILSLDVLPDATTYFTSGADAVVAAHRIPNFAPDGDHDRAVKTKTAEGDDPPISIPSTWPGEIPETGEDEEADDPPISIPDDAAEALSFSKRPIVDAQSQRGDRKAGGLSSLLSNASSPLANSKAQVLPRPAPVVQPPYKINNTKHAGQQSLSVRSDGRLFACGGWDSRVRIYSAKTLKEVALLKWHKEGVYAVAFAKLLEAKDLANTEVGEYGNADDRVVKRETGLSKLQRQREEKMQIKHWIAAGAKDGKISLWEIF